MSHWVLLLHEAKLDFGRRVRADISRLVNGQAPLLELYGREIHFGLFTAQSAVFTAVFTALLDGFDARG